MTSEQKIIEACQKANPSKVWEWDNGMPVGSGYIEKAECTLEDVLMAINYAREIRNWYAISTAGIFLENKVKEVTATPYAHPMISTMHSWHLGKPLSEQSEETKEFIASLL